MVGLFSRRKVKDRKSGQLVVAFPKKGCVSRFEMLFDALFFVAVEVLKEIRRRIGHFGKGLDTDANHIDKVSKIVLMGCKIGIQRRFVSGRR